MRDPEEHFSIQYDLNILSYSASPPKIAKRKRTASSCHYSARVLQCEPGSLALALAIRRASVPEDPTPRFSEA